MNANQQVKNCEGCHKLSKKLKIAISDYEFEIKKIQEDKSTEKALFEINMMKQIRKLNQKLQKEKSDHQFDNKNWMNKYDEALKENQNKIEEIKQKSKNQIEVTTAKKNKQVQQFKLNKVVFYENKIKEDNLAYQLQKKSIQENHEKLLKAIQKQSQCRIQKLQKSHKEQIKKRSDAYDATILGLKSQLKAEQNLHLKTKQQSKNIQSNLLQQIYCQKKTKFQLQEKIRNLNEKIEQQKLQIQRLNEKIVQNQKQHGQNLEKAKQMYLIREQQQKFKMENQLKIIYRKQLQDCNKYQSALTKINEHRQKQTKMYQQNIESIKSCIEDRPSRMEDMEQIIQLRQKLYKKDKQCDNLHQQLKWYRLELQNKEDIYNKIFGPNCNNENINTKKKEIKLKRAGRSVTTVREILNTMNSNHLAPLAAIDKIQKKNLPPRSTKIL